MQYKRQTCLLHVHVWPNLTGMKMCYVTFFLQVLAWVSTYKLILASNTFNSTHNRYLCPFFSRTVLICEG